MTKPTDIHVQGVTLYFLPVATRIPLKFGAEILTEVTCARVRVDVAARNGTTASGWGETPLSVQWVWPAALSYRVRHDALKTFTRALAGEWARFDESGHPLEIGHLFQTTRLVKLLEDFNATRSSDEQMPWLAALVACSAFDIALHDAYGMMLDRPVYDTYTAEYMNRDLAAFLSPAPSSAASFTGKHPADFLTEHRPDTLPVWHLVGGTDMLDKSELTGAEPDDGYPVLLRDWIDRDGLNCLKIKLRGTDADWDINRLTSVGNIAIEKHVDWLCADFNCTVADPAYVTGILDNLMREHPAIWQKILYVEQPFPYDLETHRIDVHAVSVRKPLFMDESAHDWKRVKLGRTLGWTGVALKTCKTQTGAILTLCWAKAHGMSLMVQDLTNPMLAMIPHVQLAAHAGTIMGVECNATQFYPAASAAEQAVHPGLFQRRNGIVDLSTVNGAGFGYRLNEITRDLPEPVESLRTGR